MSKWALHATSVSAPLGRNPTSGIAGRCARTATGHAAPVMSSSQPDRTVKTRRHLHYVLRTGTPEPRTPMLDSVESWNWAVRISVVGLFVVALAVIAFKMASVVVPVVLAWVVAMVLLPVVNGLERRGLSRALTSIVLVILLIASIMVIVGVLTVPLTYWVGRAGELGALLKERLQTLGNPFAFFDEIGNALSQVTGRDTNESAVNLSSSNIVTEILSVLTPVVSETLIFLVALVFNLIYHRDIQNGMLLLFRNDNARRPRYGGDTVVDRCRKFVLRCKSIADRNDCASCTVRNIAADVVMGVEVANAKSAAMKENQHRQLS